MLIAWLVADGQNGIKIDVDKMINCTHDDSPEDCQYKDYNATFVQQNENYTTTIDIGTYNQQCNMYRDPADKVDGHRVRIKVLAGPDASITKMWKLIDPKVHDLHLDLEAIMPDERSLAHPLKFTMVLNADYYAKAGGATDCESKEEAPYRTNTTTCVTRQERDTGNWVYTTEEDAIKGGLTTCVTKGDGAGRKTSCSTKPDGGVSTGGAKIEVTMIGPKPDLSIHMFYIQCDFRVHLWDGSELAFEVSGRVTELLPGGEKSDSPAISGNSSNLYQIDLHGATREPWKHPFGLKFLTVNAATIDVTTTSDLNWNETRLFLYLDTTFGGNSTLRVRTSCEIADGGEEVVLVARLNGINNIFMAMLGSASGAEDDINATKVGDYLDEMQTSEDLMFYLSTVEKRQYESGFDIIGSGIRKGITFKLNLLNYNRTVEDVVAGENLQGMIGAFVGARSELDIHFWVGIFDNYASIPPMEIRVDNVGANLVFGNGLVTVVDWMVGAKFNSARSAWPWLFAKTTIIFRPSDRDEIKLIAEGSPLKIAAHMYGIWYEPLGLEWLAVANLGVDFNFVQNTTDWFVVDRCKFRGTAIIGFVISGRVTAEFVRDSEGYYTNLMYMRMQFYYVITQPPSKVVNEILKEDTVSEGGARRLAEYRRLGQETCGSGTTVPTIELNFGMTGKNVTFLQQVRECERECEERCDDAANSATVFLTPTL